MPYPKMPDYARLTSQLQLYSELKHEYGAKGIQPILARAERALKTALAELKRLPIDNDLAREEPDGLTAIQRLRPAGPRRIWTAFDAGAYKDRIAGALLGRMAGCTLGAPVEFWPVARMEDWARQIGDAFPPVDYWSAVPDPEAKRYQVSRCAEYTRGGMNGVPVDDDIAYTLLGLLVLEDFGPDFTVDEIGKAWLKYLPYACTAEEIALKNLKKGVPAKRAGEKDNPFCQWIGADIRSDPWGYLAPGWPERAAAMAYHDARVSHRRNGIYGEMYFAAVIAAAFTVSDPLEALEIGLMEIPARCALSKGVRWALRVAPTIHDYREAREAMERKFGRCERGKPPTGMHPVHTINNACLTIWGVTIGRTDFTRVISETVAMGMDNDCTAATAGSIVGAVVGAKGIPAHWHANFNNTVHSYLIGRKRFSITGLLRRFEKQARRVHETA